MKIVANLNPVTDASACGVVCYTAVVFAAFLCQVINSGINVIFYWAFASRFRELFKVRVARLSCRRRPRRLADRRRNTAVMYVSN
nr:hypothetical protein BaRGS_011017 [Batillaria attramentaria]